ncbi:MAG: hypothetical protein K1X83_03630 [Oligoflexia bacterium]|nr:hypothetical protein [Oligoflexia bacterium]
MTDLNWMRHAELLSQNQGDPQEHLKVILGVMSEPLARDWLLSALKQNQIAALQSEAARSMAYEALSPFSAEPRIQRAAIEELQLRLARGEPCDRIVAVINKIADIRDHGIANQMIQTILGAEVPNLAPVLAVSPPEALLSRITKSLQDEYAYQKHEFTTERVIEALRLIPHPRARALLTQLAENRLEMPPEEKNKMVGLPSLAGFWGAFVVGITTNNVALYVFTFASGVLIDLFQNYLFQEKNKRTVRTVPQALQDLAHQALEFEAVRAAKK